MKEFLLSLAKRPRGKVLQAVQILSEFGPSLPFPYSSQVKGKLRELRAHFGRTLYRILYYQDAQGTFILLHAFGKKTPKTPRREIRIARERMLEHQAKTRRKG